MCVYLVGRTSSISLLVPVDLFNEAVERVTFVEMANDILVVVSSRVRSSMTSDLSNVSDILGRLVEDSSVTWFEYERSRL